MFWYEVLFWHLLGNIKENDQEHKILKWEILMNAEALQTGMISSFVFYYL
jgi:hypothetical protein